MPRVRQARAEVSEVPGDKWFTDRLLCGRELDFVEWYDEPHHKLLWSNEYTNIYTAIIPPGEGTLFHRHTKDTAYAMLNSAEGPGETVIATNQFVIRDVELPPIPVVLSKGHCICYNLKAWEANQFIHSIVVPSCAKGPVKMLGAEAKSQPAFGADKPLSAHGYNLHKDGKHQRAYRLTLAPGAQTGVHRWDFCGAILVVQADTLKVEVKSGESALGDGSRVKNESYHWQEKPVELNIINPSKTKEVIIVVVEWKKKAASGLFGFFGF